MIVSNMQDDLTTDCKKTQAKKLPSKKILSEKTPARKQDGVTILVDFDAHALLKAAYEKDGRIIKRTASDCIRRVLGGAK